jgi:hypothetical protein
VRGRRDLLERLYLDACSRRRKGARDLHRIHWPSGTASPQLVETALRSIDVEEQALGAEEAPGERSESGEIEQ